MAIHKGHKMAFGKEPDVTSPINVLPVATRETINKL